MAKAHFSQLLKHSSRRKRGEHPPVPLMSGLAFTAKVTYGIFPWGIHVCKCVVNPWRANPSWRGVMWPRGARVRMPRGSSEHPPPERRAGNGAPRRRRRLCFSPGSLSWAFPNSTSPAASQPLPRGPPHPGAPLPSRLSCSPGWMRYTTGVWAEASGCQAKGSSLSIPGCVGFTAVFMFPARGV